LQFTDPRLLTGLIAAGGAAVTAYWWFSRRRLSPEEREKFRRLTVNQSRRWIEGEVSEADESSVHYTYDFRGVSYAASQEVHSLVHMLPANPGLMVGRHATVKFDPANPANSIVICEEWSGLPGAPRAQSQKSEGED
jgi:hypothetical protein